MFTKSLIGEADESTFRQRVVEASHQLPVLVDFSAEWCGPCRVIEPVLQRIATEMEGRIRVIKIDADENMKLCGHYRLRGFPTVLLFANGEELGRFSGAQPLPRVRHFLETHLDGAPASP